jgi:hypothetical protein
MSQVGFRLYMLINHLFDYQEQEMPNQALDRSRTIVEAQLEFYQTCTACRAPISWSPRPLRPL